MMAFANAGLQITFLPCKEHMLSVASNRGIVSQVCAKGIAKKRYPCPWVSSRMSVWPLTISGNSFQKVKMEQETLIERMP
jgi:hypothetical protein